MNYKPYQWQYDDEPDAHVQEWRRTEAAKMQARESKLLAEYQKMAQNMGSLMHESRMSKGGFIQGLAHGAMMIGVWR